MNSISKILILVVGVLSFSNVQAARWGETVWLGSQDGSKIESKPLKAVFDVYQSEMGLLVDEDSQVYPDYSIAVTDLHFKKPKEDLRNSIKQLLYIQGSEWYCDFETDVDDFMETVINGTTVDNLVETTIGEVIYNFEVTVVPQVYTKLKSELYNAVKNFQGIEMTGSTSYCQDEYASQWTLNIYDTYSDELVQITMGVSE